MIVLLDTNVVIDALTNRGTFAANSINAIKKALTDSDDVFVACSSVIDIMYILRKELKDGTLSRQAIQNFLFSFSVADIYSEFIDDAFSSPMPDFEDAVISRTAVSVGANYIITRNKPDFANSKVPALTPDEFLALK